MWAILAMALGAAGGPGLPDDSLTTLELRVVDARDELPLAEVSIEVERDGTTLPATVAVDGGRSHRVAIPVRATQSVRISARKEGFVPAHVIWRGADALADLPGSYTLTLEPGTPVGGTVRDARGKPIPGARVYTWFHRRRGGAGREERWFGDEALAVTDERGRWQTATVPAALDSDDRLMFRLVHPDYVSEPIAFARTAPIDELRAMTAVLVMEDGATLTGRVVDDRGQPIAGARVTLNVPGFVIDPDSMTEEQAACLRTMTGEDGRFRLAHVEPGEQTVFVEAEGFDGRNAKVVAGASPAPEEIRLTSMEEIFRNFDRFLEDQKAGGGDEPPEDLPEEWVMPGILAVVAAVVVARLLWRRLRPGRRGESQRQTR